jgi:hypothetical protein
MIRWQYETVPIGDNFAAELDTRGAAGWELCGIHVGLAFFKRNKHAVAFEQQAAAHAAERGGR